jgi:hypothetical protein
MGKRAVLWIIAVVLTLGSAVYQRLTGPTYPVRGTVVLGGDEIRYRLARSHETTSDQPVEIVAPDPGVTGELSWRRYPTADPYERVPLTRSGDRLSAALPRQPAAGKLEYQVRLMRGEERVLAPPRPAVTRYKDPVSTAVLIAHVLAMFLGMLWATRAGLAAVSKEPTRGLTFVTLALLLTGGFVLGPLMQHQAFGEWWTGIPFGYDLTDNKTLVAGVAWVTAALRMRGQRETRVAVALAAVVTMVVFAIPHSVWGSQINWEQVPR